MIKKTKSPKLQLTALFLFKSNGASEARNVVDDPTLATTFTTSHIFTIALQK
jgi:hypothetical protein